MVNRFNKRSKRRKYSSKNSRKRKMRKNKTKRRMGGGEPEPEPEAPTIPEQHAFLDLAESGDFEGMMQMLRDNNELINVQPIRHDGTPRQSALHKVVQISDNRKRKFYIKELINRGADWSAVWINSIGETKLPRDLLHRNGRDDDEEISLLDGGGGGEPEPGAPTITEQHAFLDLAESGNYEGMMQMLRDNNELINVQPLRHDGKPRQSALHRVAQILDNEKRKFYIKELTNRGANCRAEWINSRGETKLPRDLLHRNGRDNAEEISLLDGGVGVRHGFREVLWYGMGKRGQKKALDIYKDLLIYHRDKHGHPARIGQFGPLTLPPGFRGSQQEWEMLPDLDVEVIDHYLSDSDRLISTFFGVFSRGTGDLTEDESMMFFIEGIYNSISKVDYPVADERNPLYHKYNGYPRSPQQVDYVPRRNHGALNHIRTIIFFCDYMRFFSNKTNGWRHDWYRHFFPTNKHLNIAIINSMFHSIMRVSEGHCKINLISGDWVAKGMYYLDEEEINKIFPIIGEQINRIFREEAAPLRPKNNIQSYVSSIIFISLMKSILTEEYHEYIEYLALSHTFYMNGTRFLRKIDSIKDFNGAIDDIDLKIYIYVGLGRIGHYLDHCRAPVSDMIDDPTFKTLNDICLKNYGENWDIEEIIKKVIETIKRTEYNTEQEFPRVQGSTIYSMRQRCNGLRDTGTRYANPHFFRYSNNFDEWAKGELITSINLLKSVRS